MDNRPGWYQQRGNGVSDYDTVFIFVYELGPELRANLLLRISPSLCVVGGDVLNAFGFSFACEPDEIVGDGMFEKWRLRFSIHKTLRLPWRNVVPTLAKEDYKALRTSSAASGMVLELP
jgi:hypothetical protein